MLGTGPKTEDAVVDLAKVLPVGREHRFETADEEFTLTRGFSRGARIKNKQKIVNRVTCMKICYSTSAGSSNHSSFLSKNIKVAQG